MHFGFGIGIWTVEQILVYAIILLVFQFLKKIPVFQKSLILQVIFAVVAGFLYGFPEYARNVVIPNEIVVIDDIFLFYFTV